MYAVRGLRGACSRALLGNVAAVVFGTTVVFWANGSRSEPTPQPDEIVVTARKREEPLQSAPLSVSAISRGELLNADAARFPDVIALAPNVSMSGGIAGVLQGQVGIRGISGLVRNIGTEANVGLFVDGIYQGRPDNYVQDLLDVDQIEILRGPQGTLFGKNTLAGVFNIKTRSPSDHPVYELNLTSGNYGLIRTGAFASGPLVPGRLLGKLSLSYSSSDGYYKHLSGGQDGDALDLLSYRGGMQLRVNDQSKVTVAVDGLRDRGHPAFFQITDLAGFDSAMETRPHTINNNRPDALSRDNYGISVTADLSLDRTTLTSLSAFRHASYALSLDDDQEQIDRIAADLAHDVTDFVSQELRLSGSMGSRTNYVLGLYYFDQRITTDRLLTLGIDSGLPPGATLTTAGQVRTTSYALFGEIEHRFDFGLVWGVGLRFTREHRDANFTQRDPTGTWTMIGLPNLAYAGSADDEDLSPSLTLLQPISPDIAVYGRIATGLNSAAFNVDLVSSTAGLTARPERATSFEIGLKSDLFRRRLRANAALFMTYYDDMQVSQLLGVGVSLDNAGKATIKGFEVELTGHVSSRIKLNASLGYVDAVYDRYPQCGVPVSLGGGSTDCAGNTIIGAPRYTFSSSVEYAVPVSIGAVVARVSYNFQSPVNFEATNSPRFRSDARNIFDAHIGLSTVRWDLSAWAKNVTDDVYVAYRDDRSAIGARQTTAYGDPRTFGVTATFRF